MTINLVSETSSIKMLSGKRSLEYGACDFPRGFKVPRVSAIRHFPPDCGAVVRIVHETCNDKGTLVETSNERSKAGTNKPLIEMLPTKLNSESMMPPVEMLPNELKSESKAPVLDSNTLFNNVEMGLSRVPKKFELINERNNKNMPKHIDMSCSSDTSPRPCVLPKKYPSLKFRKGATIFRHFPRGCEKWNLDLSSKCDLLADVKSSDAERKMFQANNERIRSGYTDVGSGFARKGQERLLEDTDDKITAETGKATRVQKDELFEKVDNFECKLNQEADIDTIIIASSPRSNSLQEDSIKITCNNNDGAKIWVDTNGSDSEENIKLSEGLTGPVMCSVMNESVDLGHSDGGIVPSTQQGVKTLDCIAATRATDVEDGQYNAVSYQKQNGALSVKQSDDLTNNGHHEALNRTKFHEVLNMFEKLLKERLLEIQLTGQKKKSNIYTKIAMMLKKQEKWLYMNQRVLGAIPGVEVGDQFHYRAELVIVGLHVQFMAGIDYMEKDGKKIATSIVSSGRSSSGVKEFSDVLIYSGEGGNQLMGVKNSRDQELVRGNLALKNSMDEETPVRVIQGRRSWKEKSTTFTYDGLYFVNKFWQERAENGNLVYMFQLSRMQSQPKLQSSSTLINDISSGKEKISIRVVNDDIDNDKPPPFNYITKMVYPQLHDTFVSGCLCIDGCSDHVQCSCVIKNGGMVPFNENGALLEATHTIVHECGPSCKCPPSCQNRVSQHGLKCQLEVYKTKMKGWGVRSRNFISSGSFICEYVGELLNDKQAEERIDLDEYLFDIGGEDGYAIDAAQIGNIGRFVNHSCSPNLYARNVLFDHNDKMMPHVMLFATENIRPLQELTYDYHYKIDHVHDSNGNIKKKDCHCGAAECNGRLY